MISVVEYFNRIKQRKSIRVVISADQKWIDNAMPQVLEEAKKTTFGKYTAYKHQPHFQGGEYHGHCDVGNGKEVSWTLTGKRLHPNKFPADDKIPNDSRNAVAKVLSVSPNLLEGYIAFDEIENENVILFELKKSKASILLETLKS